MSKKAMFQKSLLLVFAVLAAVMTTAFSLQMVQTAQLPSSYDSGLTIEAAYKSSSKPMLLEFYSDPCQACRRMTPLLHTLYNRSLKQEMTLVMVNVEDPKNQMLNQLFGIDELPGLFVFDARKLIKVKIGPRHFVSEQTLYQAIGRAVNTPPETVSDL